MQSYPSGKLGQILQSLSINLNLRMVGDNDKEIETELKEEIPAVRTILDKENNETISDNTEDSNENVKKEKLFQEWSQIMEIRLKSEDERHNKEMMEMVEKLDKKYAKCLEITKENGKGICRTRG